MRIKMVFAAALLLVGGLALPTQDAIAADGQAQAEILPLESLIVRTGTGARLRFAVEVARTEPQRNTGMMFRTQMARDRGMLFLFYPAQPVSFWMRNTLLPLDMIFIRKDGRIANIIENAEPLSLTVRSSEGPVVAVLELAGGSAKRLGIAPGDRVSHKAIGKRL
jgi:uncharacterized protein